MRRLRTAFAIALVLAPAAGIARDLPARHGHSRPGYADPSAVIAAELAFSRLATDKGQWTAFRATSASDAEMFVPQRVQAADWLKHRADPPVPVKWQASEVWSSCDGSHAVTRGRWERPGSAGTFVTVWQRQSKGGYKWLLDMSLDDERQVAAPDMVAGKVADCGRSAKQIAANLADQASRAASQGARAAMGQRDVAFGSSTDGTLTWESRATADGRRGFTVHMWSGKAFETVIDTDAPLQAR